MSDNGYMMLDEAEAYNIGFLDGSDDQYYTDRIAAFGAIRRAAEVARNYDYIADTAPYNDAGRKALYSRAHAIRDAIRVAIGSLKV